MIALILSFLASAAGFCVYDLYRLYGASGKKPVTFKSIKARTAHIVIYCAAGILGIFVNIDVIAAIFSELPEVQIPLSGLVAGTIVRSFSLGLLGPAGIRRAQSSQTIDRNAKPPDIDIEDTDVREASFLDYMKYYLTR